MKDKFHQAIKALIECNIAQRPTDREMIAMLGPLAFAKEFCTVCIGAHRRSGKSEYIKRNAGVDDVVIVASAAHRLVVYGEMGFPVVPSSTILEWATGRCVRSTIYIDEPDLVFKRTSANDIYGALFKDENQTFVLIGTFSNWR